MRPLDSLASEVLDLLGYLIVCAPELPAEDETSLSKEFGRLTGLIEGIRERIGGDDRRQRLALVLVELRDALSSFESGCDTQATSQLELAERHFREAWEGRTAPGRIFAVDGDGVASVEREEQTRRSDRIEVVQGGLHRKPK